MKNSEPLYMRIRDLLKTNDYKLAKKLLTEETEFVQLNWQGLLEISLRHNNCPVTKFLLRYYPTVGISLDEVLAYAEEILPTLSWEFAERSKALFSSPKFQEEFDLAYQRYEKTVQTVDRVVRYRFGRKLVLRASGG